MGEQVLLPDIIYWLLNQVFQLILLPYMIYASHGISLICNNWWEYKWECWRVLVQSLYMSATPDEICLITCNGDICCREKKTRNSTSSSDHCPHAYLSITECCTSSNTTPLPHSVLLSSSWLRNPLSSIRAAPSSSLLLPHAFFSPTDFFSCFWSIMFFPGSESFPLLPGATESLSPLINFFSPEPENFFSC